MNHFSLKMHQAWHMSFCMTILTRKFNKIFLLKLSFKNSYVKLDAFSKRNGSFFPSKARPWEAKVLNWVNWIDKSIFFFIELLMKSLERDRLEDSFSWHNQLLELAQNNTISFFFRIFVKGCQLLNPLGICRNILIAFISNT